MFGHYYSTNVPESGFRLPYVKDSVQDAAESDEQDEEDFSLLVGHRCFAPCPLAEGMGVARHAAIVMDVEGFDGQTGLMVPDWY